MLDIQTSAAPCSSILDPKCRSPFAISLKDSMFQKPQPASTGVHGSTHVAIRPGYTLLPGCLNDEARDSSKTGTRIPYSFPDGCTECAWAQAEYGQPGGMVAVLTSGYGPQASTAAAQACQQLQQHLTNSLQSLKLGKVKSLKALAKAFNSVQTPAADRGRSGALGLAVYVDPHSASLHLASTGGANTVLAVMGEGHLAVEAVQLPQGQETSTAELIPGLFSGKGAAQLLLHSYALDPALRHQFIIAACPALWEVMPPAEAVRFVHRYSQLQCRGVSAADALTLEAQQRRQHLLQQQGAQASSVPTMAALVAFLQAPLGSELQCGADSRLAAAASSAQEAELQAAAWKLHPETHPGHFPAADLFPHLAQAGEPYFWGSVAPEELPAPEFTQQDIGRQLQAEAAGRGRRSSGSETELLLLSSSSSFQRQASQVLSSLPEDVPFSEDVLALDASVRSKASHGSSLLEMAALADMKAEQQELQAVRGMVAAAGAAAAEGRVRRQASGALSEARYMAERVELPSGQYGQCPVATPPLHQAVRALERKVHGRSFVRSSSSTSSEGSSPPGPANGSTVRSTAAAQIDAMLGLRVRKVVPPQWQEPGSLASIQAWLTSSSAASMEGGLVDPSQQPSARPSLERSHSSGSLQLELRQQQPGCLRRSTGQLAGQGSIPAALQRAQSAVSCGALRLLDLAELSVSYNSNGDSPGEGLAAAAAAAEDEAPSPTSTATAAPPALPASASAQSLSSCGSSARAVRRRSSWGTTMASARSMLASLRAAGGSAAQLTIADVGPDRRSRRQLLAPPPSSPPSLPEPQAAALGSSSIPEGSTLLLPRDSSGTAFAEVDFDALSRQYCDQPEPAVRGGRLRRYSSASAMSARSASSAAEGAGEGQQSPLQRLLSQSLSVPAAAGTCSSGDAEGGLARAASAPAPPAAAEPIRIGGSHRRSRRSLLDLVAAGEVDVTADAEASEGCVRGGVRSLARSGSRLGSSGSERLGASLGSSAAAGCLTLASSLEEGAALAASSDNSSGSQGRRCPPGHTCTYSPLLAAAEQQCGGVGQQQQQRAGSASGSGSFLQWHIGEGSHSRQQLSPFENGGSALERVRSTAASAHHSRTASQESGATCITIGEGLGQAGAAAEAASPPAGSADCACDLSGGGHSVLKLSGLRYSYHEGPLSPTSAHTGAVGAGRLWLPAGGAGGGGSRDG